MSLWMRWLSTTVPAATLAVPFGNDAYVPGLTASTLTALASVTFWRSSNATAEVAFSSALSFTDAGAELSLISEPVDPEMSAPATVTVETRTTADRQMTTSLFVERTEPRPFSGPPESSDILGLRGRYPAVRPPPPRFGLFAWFPGEIHPFSG